MQSIINSIIGFIFLCGQVISQNPNQVYFFEKAASGSFTKYDRGWYQGKVPAHFRHIRMDRALQIPFQNFKSRLDSIVSTDKLDPDLVSKKVFTYTSTEPDAALSSTSICIWDATVKKWLNQSRSLIGYDQNNMIKTYLYQEGQNQIWVNSTQSEYFYDQNGRLVRILSYDWNLQNGVWDLSSKDTFVYNPSKLLVFSEYFSWDKLKKAWVKEIKSELEYNAKSQLITTTYSRWNKQFNSYLFESREENSYHANGKSFEFIYSNWDENMADWIYTHKFSDWYDAKSRLISYQQHFYDGVTWIPVNKTDISYDANENPVNYVNSNWDFAKNKWIEFFKWENAYDNKYVFSELLVPNPELDETKRDFKHQLLKSEYFSFNAGNPVNDATDTYYYTTLNPVNTTDVFDLPVLVYPNPAHDRLLIRNSGDSEPILFKLFDLLGQQQSVTLMDPTDFVSIGHLPPGIYLYQLRIQNKVFTGKIKKQ